MNSMRPALKYFGGKYRLAPWLISHFPQHTCYVEPFCGSASVFFRKRPSEIEVLNDMDEEIINFFRVLREQPGEFVQAVNNTPFSRQELDLAWSTKGKGDAVEIARKLYVRLWQGWGSKSDRKSGWAYQVTNKRGRLNMADWQDTAHFQAITNRLRRAYIEHDDALSVIERYDGQGTFFYCDPPYLNMPRSYECAVSEEYHRRLLSMLLTIQGSAIISGYPSDMYDDYLSGWHKASTVNRTMNTQNVGTETIWVSPRAVEMGQGMLWKTGRELT